MKANETPNTKERRGEIKMKNVHFLPAAAIALLANAIGAQAATMINTAPYVITAPGNYQLAANLTTSGATNAIEIKSARVTLDLGGYTISCTNCRGANGVVAENMDINIQNGFVVEFNGGVWPNVGDGIYYAEGSSGKVSRVTASGNGTGIGGAPSVYLDIEESTTRGNSVVGIDCPFCRMKVVNTEVFSNALNGVSMGAGMVTGSFIYGNGGHGIVLNPGRGYDNLTHITNTFIQAVSGDAVFQNAESFFTSGLNTLLGYGNPNGIGGGAVGGTVNFTGMSSAGVCYTVTHDNTCPTGTQN
jgi:hypothetical protein